MNLDMTESHPAMDYRAHLDTYRTFVRVGIVLTALVAMSLVLMATFLL